MGHFFEEHKLLQLTQNEVDNLKSNITINKIEFIIKNP